MVKSKKPKFSGANKKALITQKKPLTIMYSDRLNYYDLAATIRDMFIRAVENHDNVGGPIMDEDINLEEFAKYLEKGFLTEALNEFTNTSFGKGLLMGAYLEHVLEKAKREEREALREMGEDVDDEEAEA